MARGDIRAARKIRRYLVEQHRALTGSEIIVMPIGAIETGGQSGSATRRVCSGRRAPGEKVAVGGFWKDSPRIASASVRGEGSREMATSKGRAHATSRDGTPSACRQRA